MLCFGSVCCVLAVCVVFWQCVLCFGCVCCVLAVCVVFCTCGPPYTIPLLAQLFSKTRIEFTRRDCKANRLCSRTITMLRDVAS